jgi:hypothetical protein
MKYKLPFFLSILVYLYLFSGCVLNSSVQEKASPTMPAALSLLVEIDSFPKGWTSASCNSSLCEKDGGLSLAGQDYYLKGASGHAYEEVYRFSSNEEAGRIFSTYKDNSFNKSDVRSPFSTFQPPSDIKFESNIADESYLACGVDVIPQCQFIARYKAYLIYFYFDRSSLESPGGLTYPEIENVLVKLEAKVADVLKP